MRGASGISLAFMSPKICGTSDGQSLGLANPFNNESLEQRMYKRIWGFLHQNPEGEQRRKRARRFNPAK